MRHEHASGRLSGDDVVRLSEQIAGLTSAGLALGPGLLATAEELPRGRLRSALVAIAGSMDRGSSVADAVAEQGATLPDHLRGLVLVGARTGKMSQVLGRFVEFVSLGTDLNRRLWMSLAYPIISLIAALLVFVFICTSIVGSFEAIFKDFGVPLPKLTILLLIVSRVFSVSSRVLFEGLIGFAVFWMLARLVLRKSTRRSLMAGIPLLGAVWRNTSLAEFCHLLGLLLDCEVPLAEAIGLTGDGVQDDSMRRACTVMASDTAQGTPLSQAVARQPIFPKGLYRVLEWAEGHQSLPTSLHMVGEMFEARARAQVGLAGTVVGVVTIISVLFGVAVVVVGLFLPLITLISRLSG